MLKLNQRKKLSNYNFRSGEEEFFLKPFINKTIFLSFFCTVFFSYGHVCAEDSGTKDAVLAVIGGSKINAEDFKEEMKRRGHNMPGSFASFQQKEVLLQDMVRSEMLYASALEAGYDRKPEIIEALKRIMISRFREDMLGPEFSKIKTDDAEIEAYYRQHPEKYMSPQMIRCAVIYVAVPQKASDEKRAELLKKAQDARAEALKLDLTTLSFGAVAVQYSDDQATRYRGGDSGLVTAREGSNRWDKEVIEALFALEKPGEISPVVTSPTGFYIVKLIEKKESSIRSLNEVKDIISYQIVTDKRNKVEKEFFEKLKAKVNVSVNSDLLKTIDIPDAGRKLEPPALPGK